MTLLQCDIEEGVLSEREISSIEGDEDFFLDRFEDPFTNAPKW